MLELFFKALRMIEPRDTADATDIFITKSVENRLALTAWGELLLVQPVRARGSIARKSAEERLDKYFIWSLFHSKITCDGTEERMDKYLK